LQVMPSVLASLSVTGFKAPSIKRNRAGRSNWRSQRGGKQERAATAVG
jgi:hypothetical protein